MQGTMRKDGVPDDQGSFYGQKQAMTMQEHGKSYIANRDQTLNPAANHVNHSVPKHAVDNQKDSNKTSMKNQKPSSYCDPEYDTKTVPEQTDNAQKTMGRSFLQNQKPPTYGELMLNTSIQTQNSIKLSLSSHTP